MFTLNCACIPPRISFNNNIFLHKKIVSALVLNNIDLNFQSFLPIHVNSQ